jgi:hypothetical protein
LLKPCRLPLATISGVLIQHEQLSSLWSWERYYMHSMNLWRTWQEKRQECQICGFRHGLTTPKASESDFLGTEPPLRFLWPRARVQKSIHMW